MYDITEDHAHLAVVGLGPKNEGAPDVSAINEDIDVIRENVRSAAAVGTKLLQGTKVANILLDDLSDAEACAEGSVLSLFSFDRLKAEKKRKEIPHVNLLRYALVTWIGLVNYLSFVFMTPILEILAMPLSTVIPL